MKRSNFLENSEIPLEIPLETMPKNVISWISSKEQNIASFKLMIFFKLEIQHRSNSCFEPLVKKRYLKIELSKIL